jgi:acetoin utilization deacetylase AcuC-like enzyme
MDKFDRIAHALTHTCKQTHPATSGLPRPLVRSPDDFFRPLEAANVPHEDWLSGPIDADFVRRFTGGLLTTEECRYIGFREQTSRPELIERTLLEVAGTVLTCQLACRYGIASNVAGGTHHATPISGAGYTILNDLAVATHVLTSSPATTGLPVVKRVLVVDCDVHQGDGTAKFGATAALKDKLFTLSLHCASNYPSLKAHSTFDVGLRDGMRDDEYMEILEESVNHAIQEVQPDFVLYDAGVDVYEHDKLGRLKISEEGIRRRDRWVLDRCVSLGIPVAAVVGGGYDKDVDALGRRHAIVHEECAYVWRKHRMWER